LRKIIFIKKEKKIMIELEYLLFFVKSLATVLINAGFFLFLASVNFFANDLAEQYAVCSAIIGIILNIFLLTIVGAHALHVNRTSKWIMVLIHFMEFIAFIVSLAITSYQTDSFKSRTGEYSERFIAFAVSIVFTNLTWIIECFRCALESVPPII
jgi:hypothetical protein